MKVPGYASQVSPEGLPDARQRIEVAPENFLGNTQAAALETMAGIGDRVNRAAMDIVGRQIEDANATRAQDGYNQALAAVQDALYGPDGAFNVRGEAVFAQPNGKPLTENVMDGLAEKFNTIGDSLGNTEQRRLFAAQSEPLLLQTRGQLLQHEGEQYRVYRRGVGEASIAAQKNAIGLNYNDPQLIRRSLDAVHAASSDLAALAGLGDAAGAEEGHRQASEALSGAVDAALQHGDHAAAERVMENFSAEMLPNALLRNAGLLAKAREAVLAENVSQAVVAEMAPRLAASDMDRMINITRQAESGGAHFGTDGRPVAGRAGGQGSMQVLAATGAEAAAAAGVKWLPELFGRTRSGDPQRDGEAEAYNLALGSAYLRKQLADFAGNPAKAWAAYQAGPGAVRAAQAKFGADWLSAMPKETQAYVERHMKAFAAGEGGFPRPTLAEALAKAEAKLGGDASPGLHKQLREALGARFALLVQAQKQREEDGLAEALRQVQANGGRYAALPVRVQAAIPPDKAGAVMDFAGKVARGEPVHTDWALYYQLRSDRPLLKRTNLLAFKDRLGDTEFKQLADLQQRHAAPGTFSTQVRSAADILNQYMRQAGIDPEPQRQNTAAAETVGRIWSAYEQRVADFEALAGHKATTQDLEKVAAQLFTKVPVRNLLFGVHGKPAVLLDRGKDRIAVPDAERRQIEEAWRQARPGVPLSEQDVDALYLRRLNLP